MADGDDTKPDLSEDDVRTIMRWLALRAAQARSDPALFFEFVLREEVTRKRLKLAAHQRLTFEFVMAHPMCVVREPVGFSKTYMMLALTLWLLGNDPMQRGAVVSAAQGQSKKVVGAARTHIEQTEELHLTFPRLRPSRNPGDRWTQDAITIDRGKTIQRDVSLVAVGIGGKLPGARLSWVLADDLLTHENTGSEQQREHVRDWFVSTVLTRQDAVGSRIVVCNVPWFAKRGTDSVGDLTYELEAPPYSWPSLTLDAHGDVEIRNTDWDSELIRPAYEGRNSEGVRHRLTAHDHPDFARYAGEEPVPGWVDRHDQVPLWPEKFPWAVLDEKKKIGAFEYLRSYRCKPRDDNTSPVKIEWIERCKAKAVHMNLHRTADSVDPQRFAAVVTAIDPAFAKGKKSNKTSILTFGILGTGERAILENQVGRWQGPEIADRAVSASTRFGSVVVVEGNAAQRWMRDMVRDRNKTVSIRTAFTGSNKHDPRYGVQSIFLEVEDALWLLPNDGYQNAQGLFVPGICPDGVQELISDMLEFHPDRHTGDSLMSLWIGREFARRLGMLRPTDSDGEDNLAALIGAR